ncbi:serine protease [Aspergillus homomorphus CBS 101889]|uniref:Trypsin-like serine protease n=1 Tax=Aspergillus homomorphus (strain CBS 101889) TaxID=1450537 RepID=A0A395HH54_ASPHC|nr:trypsin-like serine protease [Aspergillus homomorphus CBS 101889]RAL06823.1 trypsin-like serine protease [Aspergillus homomorphus CBS 101889]
MKYFLAIFFAFAAAELKPLIVGGSKVSIEDYPYQIALLYGGYRNCGGSIISRNHVVTAAHCVSSARASELNIRANSSLCDSGGTVVNISSITIHPNYYAPRLDNDIAILTLAESLTYGPGIQPVGLPEPGSNLISNGREAVVSCWGSISEGGASSPKLRAVNVSVVSMEECRADYRGLGHITDSMFCAGAIDSGKSACNGDSGGPVVADKILIGIVSWGHGCAGRGYPEVHSNMAYLRNLITQTTGL